MPREPFWSRALVEDNQTLGRRGWSLSFVVAMVTNRFGYSGPLRGPRRSCRQCPRHTTQAPQDLRANPPRGPPRRRRRPLARTEAGVSYEGGSSASAAHLAPVDASVHTATASSSVAVPGGGSRRALSCLAAAATVEGVTPPCAPRRPSPWRPALRRPSPRPNATPPASCQWRGESRISGKARGCKRRARTSRGRWLRRQVGARRAAELRWKAKETLRACSSCPTQEKGGGAVMTAFQRCAEFRETPHLPPPALSSRSGPMEMPPLTV